jgi:hypothetical protein
VKATAFCFVLIGVSMLAVSVLADDCTTIPEGELVYSVGHYSAGTPLRTGYDFFGYNYQGHMFRGSYFNTYAGGANLGPYAGDDGSYLAEWPQAENHWAWPFRDTKLMMKWNDAWLSNKDCDGDSKLDRYYGFDSYIGSGAWLTNHMWGSYELNGEECGWDYFVKIVAAPVDAYVEGGVWYTVEGEEIGPEIWGAFAIIQQVENDACAGLEGLQYKGFVNAGFGGW